MAGDKLELSRSFRCTAVAADSPEGCAAGGSSSDPLRAVDAVVAGADMVADADCRICYRS